MFLRAASSNPAATTPLSAAPGRPPAEQLYRVTQEQRRDGHGGLTGHPERFPAGREDVHLGARLEQRRGDRGAGAEQVLAVIEDEQHVPAVQLVASTLRRLLMYRSGSRAARMLSGSRVSSRSVSSLMTRVSEFLGAGWCA